VAAVAPVPRGNDLPASTKAMPTRTSSPMLL
jgi:hypothetical protein